MELILPIIALFVGTAIGAYVMHLRERGHVERELASLRREVDIERGEATRFQAGMQQRLDATTSEV
ncbi:MAG: hypothetical protein RBT71_11885, partial [Flavobacteriales bacterium]|nr:hypothetical protein [Flavobacteriales bacterium]